MNKSRLIQIVLLIIVFIVGVLFWNSSSTPAEVDNSYYVPPAP